jgi:hypothetical protein
MLGGKLLENSASMMEIKSQFMVKMWSMRWQHFYWCAVFLYFRIGKHKMLVDSRWDCWQLNFVLLHHNTTIIYIILNNALIIPDYFCFCKSYKQLILAVITRSNVVCHLLTSICSFTIY